jgi:Zn-dependent protease
MSSLKLGRVKGIDLYVHWTFLLLLIFWGLQGFQQGGVSEAVFNIVMITAVFGCVLLHELGHSLTALRFGIHTRDILLSPIGGIASLERIPREPKKEFLITIGGPAVNVAIAGIIFVLTFAVDPETLTNKAAFVVYDFFIQLMWVNVVLAIFNMLPAFPMDGGRILRATLAALMDYRQATVIAVRVGQVVAVGIALAAVFGYLSIIAILIAFFVFTAGEAELRSV